MQRIAGRVSRAALGLLLIAALAACAARYRNHGYVPDDDLLSEIVVGVDTRASVEETIGRPTTSGLLGETAWYYVASQFRHYGARAPREVRRDLVAVAFEGEGGTVSNVARFTLEDGKPVQLSRRVTESGIGEIALIDQLIRNFGRMTAGDIFGGGATSQGGPPQ